jgi:tetratricopeptide (TPR) repeat protein/tRNA A-37 threonylcarbamoyl transferase component Bud32
VAESPEDVSGTLNTTGQVTPHSQVSPSPQHHPGAPSDRYELRGEIARGGMGAVFAARDRVLNRDVAVKVLREEYQGHPVPLRRFVEEAQITGQIQHPGVPPVHDFGTLPGGRPFIAMKLIKGRTLSELLGERPDPRHDLPRFLMAFEQVCQAVAYAHSKGVIHRDLKPANVMVGAFGEVQVMDWGLAKVLAGRPNPETLVREETSAECLKSVIESGRTGGSDSVTQTGSLLGTPAYMPPEQARGQVELTDLRSDVFALGAILCEVLTGLPPYAGSLREIQAMALMGHQDAARARLDGCGADAELVALTRHCLAPDSPDRPADASAVAEAVAAYRAGVEGRLRRAEVEAAATAARVAEERKRRRFQVLTAFGILLAAGAVVWLWDRQASAQREERARQEAVAREEQSRREAVASEAVEAALGQAEDGLRREHLEVADAALAQAEKRLAEAGSEDLRNRLLRAQKDLAMVRELDRVMEQRWTFVDGKFDVESARRQYPAAFSRHGLAPGETPAKTLAETVRESTIRRRLIDGLDEWYAVDPVPAVAELLAEADPDPARSAIRKSLQKKGRSDWKALLRDLDVASLPPGFIAGICGGHRLPQEESIRLLQLAQAHYPDRFALAYLLASKLRNRADKYRQEAIGYHRAAVALRPDSAAARLSLGVALWDNDNREEAVACIRRALELDPRYALAHYNLGVAAKARGDVDGTILHYRKAIELDPKYSPSHNNLGLALNEKGDVEGAVACFQKAIEVDPKNARAHTNLGNVLRARGDVEGALACYHRAIEADARHAPAHNNLGAALEKKGDVEAAVACYQKALEADPGNAYAHTALGLVLKNKGNLEEAVGCFHKALDADPKYAPAHNGLGLVSEKKGDAAAAAASYRKAGEVDPKYAHGHHNLGILLKNKGDLEGAISSFRKAIAVDPKYASAHNYLGTVLEKKGELEAAGASYRKAIEIDPKYPFAHHNLGILLKNKGDLDGAIACFRKAIEADPGYASAHNNLGVALEKKGDVEGAAACYRKAVEADPKYARAHNNLGYLLKNKGDLEGAVTSFRKAVEVDPKSSPGHNNLGLALEKTGDRDAAVASFRKAIELDPKYLPAQQNLGNALFAAGQFGEARDVYRKWLELAPRGHSARAAIELRVRDGERLVALQPRLPDLLAARTAPASADEAKALSHYCLASKRYAAQVRFAESSFTARPATPTADRYNAALAACLAGTGRGVDPPPEADRPQFRRKGLAWLREELAARQKLVDAQPDNTSVARQLKLWQSEADFASVREPEALAKLPADERSEWQAFWRDVEALRVRAAPATKEP